MKKAIQFGAGNIGRGFLAQLFTQSGYEVVFVDVNKEIISALNKNKCYILQIVGEHPKEIKIKNVKGVNANDIDLVVKEIAEANIIATAVGVSHLKEVSLSIAEGIKERKERKIEEPINIIICENLLNAGKILKEYIKENIGKEYRDYVEKKVGFVESVVSRMIPIMPEELRKKDPLLIMAEEYNILPVDKQGFLGKIPKIKGMIPYDNLKVYEEHKLFIHNLGHTLSAYLGYLKGDKFIWQAIKDRKIRNIVEGAIKESGEALIKKYNFNRKEQQDYIKDLLKRFSNKALGDTVDRVGRDPIRKLGPQDRFIGAANLALKYGIIPKNICYGIAAALCYDYPEDKEAIKLKEDIKNKGIDFVLKKICKLENKDLIQLIKKDYKILKEVKNESSSI